MKSYRTLSCVFAVGATILLNGCATARLNQFRSYAQAGVAYTKASQTLTDQAGAAAIGADSALLVERIFRLTNAEKP